MLLLLLTTRWHWTLHPPVLLHRRRATTRTGRPAGALLRSVRRHEKLFLLRRHQQPGHLQVETLGGKVLLRSEFPQFCRSNPSAFY
jgi:hypothetical protein